MACLNMIHIDRSARGEAWNKVASLGSVLWIGQMGDHVPRRTRSERGKSGSYKTGAARLSIATNASIVPIAVSSGRCWPRKSFRFIPGTIAVSIGPPISPRAGESSAELMERVSNWIENEMRSIDPDAYPEAERPPDVKREEAALSQVLEAQAAAARAAQASLRTRADAPFRHFEGVSGVFVSDWMDITGS